MKQPLQDGLSHSGLSLGERALEVPFSVSSSPSTHTHWFSPFSSSNLTAESEGEPVLAFEEIFISLVPKNSCLFLILNYKGAHYFCCAAGSSPPAAGNRQASRHRRASKEMEFSPTHRELRQGKCCHSALGQPPLKKFEGPTRKICCCISSPYFAHSSTKSLQ